MSAPSADFSLDLNFSLDLKGEAADAARYYRAAAVLAQSGRAEEKTRTYALDEALRFLDLAAPLAFAGFPSGTSYSYQTAELMALTRLARSRTERLAAAGDAERAGAALYAQLRLLRPFIAAHRAIPLDQVVADVAGVLSRTRLDAASLERVQSSLRELDREDVLKEGFLRDRAVLLDMLRFRPPGFVTRPFQLSYVNDRLDVVGVLVAGSTSPWPERLTVPRKTVYSRTWRGTAALQPRDERRFLASARELAIIRCAFVAVAAARYAQAHGAAPLRIDDLIPSYLPQAPIDPFTGKSVVLAREPDGYRVSSAGRDGSDRPIEIRMTQH